MATFDPLTVPTRDRILWLSDEFGLHADDTVKSWSSPWATSVLQPDPSLAPKFEPFNPYLRGTAVGFSGGRYLEGTAPHQVTDGSGATVGVRFLPRLMTSSANIVMATFDEKPIHLGFSLRYDAVSESMMARVGNASGRYMVDVASFPGSVVPDDPCVVTLSTSGSEWFFWVNSEERWNHLASPPLAEPGSQGALRLGARGGPVVEWPFTGSIQEVVITKKFGHGAGVHTYLSR